MESWWAINSPTQHPVLDFPFSQFRWELFPLTSHWDRLQLAGAWGDRGRQWARSGGGTSSSYSENVVNFLVFLGTAFCPVVAKFHKGTFSGSSTLWRQHHMADLWSCEGHSVSPEVVPTFWTQCLPPKVWDQLCANLYGHQNELPVAASWSFYILSWNIPSPHHALPLGVQYLLLVLLLLIYHAYTCSPLTKILCQKFFIQLEMHQVQNKLAKKIL